LFAQRNEAKNFSCLASFFFLNEKETKSQEKTIASAPASRPGVFSPQPYTAKRKFTALV
jgi:hypothetical protein